MLSPHPVGILVRFDGYVSWPLGRIGQASSWRFGRTCVAAWAWRGAVWSGRWRSSRLYSTQTLWLSKMFLRADLRWCSFWRCELTRHTIILLMSHNVLSASQSSSCGHHHKKGKSLLSLPISNFLCTAPILASLYLWTKTKPIFPLNECSRQWHQLWLLRDLSTHFCPTRFLIIYLIIT